MNLINKKKINTEIAKNTQIIFFVQLYLSSYLLCMFFEINFVMMADANPQINNEPHESFQSNEQILTLPFVSSDDKCKRFIEEIIGRYKMSPTMENLRCSLLIINHMKEHYLLFKGEPFMFYFNVNVMIYIYNNLMMKRFVVVGLNFEETLKFILYIVSKLQITVYTRFIEILDNFRERKSEFLHSLSGTYEQSLIIKEQNRNILEINPFDEVAMRSLQNATLKLYRKILKYELLTGRFATALSNSGYKLFSSKSNLQNHLLHNDERIYSVKTDSFVKNKDKSYIISGILMHMRDILHYLPADAEFIKIMADAEVEELNRKAKTLTNEINEILTSNHNKQKSLRDTMLKIQGG